MEGRSSCSIARGGQKRAQGSWRAPRLRGGGEGARRSARRTHTRAQKSAARSRPAQEAEGSTEGHGEVA
eukprot:10026346-Alexandrium_andersonii.AAC.1